MSAVTDPDGRTTTDLTHATSPDAEVWQRVVARCVDHILLGLTVAMVLAPFGLGAALLPGPSRFIAGAVSAVCSSAITVGYFTILESRVGWTAGKRLVGIRVVDAAGRTPAIDQTLRRNVWTGFGVVAVVPIVGGILGSVATLGAALAILVGIAGESRDRRGWHDAWAGGTRVVRDR